MKVHLHGSHFSNNFGDTLLAYLAAATVVETDNDVLFTRPNAELETYARAHLGSRLATDPKGADCLVFHGGGYFGEPPKGSSFSWAMRFARRHASVALPYILTGKPFAIVGVGVGPVRSWLGRFLVRRLFNRASLVTVRDVESVAELRRLGVKRPLPMFPDMVFGSVSALGGTSPSERPYLVIHLGSWPFPLEDLATAIATMCGNTDRDVVLITDHENDHPKVRFCEALAAKLGTLNLQTRVHSHRDTAYLLGLLRHASAVVTDKLHVGIVASGYGVPVLSIPKHPKTPRFYAQIGLQAAVLDPSNVNGDALASALAEVRKIIIASPQALDQHRGESLHHAQAIKQFVQSVDPSHAKASS